MTDNEIMEPASRIERVICTACGRTDYEGECSLCTDGRREKLESRRQGYEE